MKLQANFIVYFLFFIGCQKPYNNGIFVINFDVRDSTRTEIVVAYQEDFGLSSFKEYIPVKSKDSTFCIIDSIKRPFTAYINIDEIQFPIWVEPNSDLNILLSKDTIMFSGKSKKYADYYSNSKNYWFKIYDEYSVRNPVLGGRPSGIEYFKVQDSMTLDRINFLETFFKSTCSSSTKNFLEHETNNLFYSDIFYKISGLTTLNEFQFYHNTSNQENETYLAFTDKFDFDNPELFQISQYRRCIEWLPNKYIKTNKLDFYKDKNEAVDFVLSLSHNELCKKYMELYLLNDFILDSKNGKDYSLKELIKERLDKLEKNSAGIENHLSLLKSRYNELIESEKKSKEFISLLKNDDYSAGIKLRDFSTDEDAEFLRKIVKDHPNKVLYVDVWAPWCGPCMKEMFHSSKLQERYKNKDVEFIFLGVSCEKESWESTIARRKINGEHYFLEEEQRDALMEMFEFSGIPRYLIINKNGIVENSNAPRPSNVGKLDGIFNKMLE